ncbi:hypothetical protein L1887_62441 [Cichorium endivia]|nr:hypothetical protein L1887_62441 [Cichorium endivia]
MTVEFQVDSGGGWQDVLDLPAHGDGEEDAEVHEQNGPEDGDVEGGRGGCQEREDDGLGGREPELELGQATNEGSKLVVSRLAVEAASEDAAHEAAGCSALGVGSGKARFALLDVLFCQILLVRRVELGREEGEEEVEEVDEERIAYDVPSLREDDAQHEEHQQASGGAPSVERVGGGDVEERLVSLLQAVGVCEELLDLRRRRCAQRIVWVVRSHHLGEELVGDDDGESNTQPARRDGAFRLAVHSRCAFSSCRAPPLPTPLRPTTQLPRVRRAVAKGGGGGRRVGRITKESISFNQCYAVS